MVDMALVSDMDYYFHMIIIFFILMAEVRCSFCGKIRCTFLLAIDLLLLLQWSQTSGL